ncbi:hypothetical protein [Microbulbifer mangrovi]|uniref:hypothetical protein n=1 Tax=Microbulbifer mangrovi TaxID=927787 RepID=UPI0009909387|nr:hypothetical protein [Microbulbifer mangrovi]
MKSMFRQVVLALPVAALVAFSVQPDWTSDGVPDERITRSAGDVPSDRARLGLGVGGRFRAEAMLPEENLCFPDFAVVR